MSNTFYEIQKFNKWWMKLLLAIPILLFVGGVVLGKTNRPESTSMLIATVIVVFIIVLFYFTKLETRVDETGITIRFFPFQRVYYYVRWDEVESASIRNYNPLMEYGGWGLRYSIKNGKAFNVSGTFGLQLVLKSGKKFLIGTQKQTDLNNYLINLKKEFQINCIQ
jgi:hypothetical protein